MNSFSDEELIKSLQSKRQQTFKQAAKTCSSNTSSVVMRDHTTAVAVFVLNNKESFSVKRLFKIKEETK